MGKLNHQIFVDAMRDADYKEYNYQNIDKFITRNSKQMQLDKIFRDYDEYKYRNDQVKAFIHAQSLTEKYDKYFETFYNVKLITDKRKENIFENNYFPYSQDALEDLFLIFTYYRRKQEWENFYVLYTIIYKGYQKYKKDSQSDFFDSPLMQPFYFHYLKFCFSSKYNHCTVNYNIALPIDCMSTAIAFYQVKKELKNFYVFTKVTYSDFIRRNLEQVDFELLSEDNKKMWELCLNDAISSMRDVLAEEKLNEYPLYSYIYARLKFLLYKVKLDCGENKALKNGKSELQRIREYVEYALRNESDNSKKMRYLAFIVEVDRYEINNRIDKQQDEVKNWEKKSLKILSAFTAFVTFAIGLLTEVMSSNLKFHEVIGGLFVLLGIAIVIFGILDVVVLEDFYLNFTKKGTGEYNGRKRILVRKCVFFCILAIIMCAMGLLIGYNAIFKHLSTNFHKNM